MNTTLEFRAFNKGYQVHYGPDNTIYIYKYDEATLQYKVYMIGDKVYGEDNYQTMCYILTGSYNDISAKLDSKHPKILDELPSPHYEVAEEHYELSALTKFGMGMASLGFVFGVISGSIITVLLRVCGLI